MASFDTVFLLMMSITAMNNSGLSTLPSLSPILTSNSSDAPSPPPLLLLSSRTSPQPPSLPLLVLTSTFASPSPYGYSVKSLLKIGVKHLCETYGTVLSYTLSHVSLCHILICVCNVSLTTCFVYLFRVVTRHR